MVRIVIRSVGNRKKSFIMTILLCILAFMMLSASIYIYENSVYSRKTIENALVSGAGHSGVIASINDIQVDTINEDMSKFRNELYKSSLISKVGEIDIASGFGQTEFGRLQAELENKSEDYFEHISIDSTAMDFYDIQLEEGRIDTDMPYDDSIAYLYLGSAYKNYYKVGDSITENIYEGFDITYTVKGFFADNTRIIYSDTLFSADEFAGDKCYMTLPDTWAIIERNSKSNSSSMLYSWEEGCTAEEAEQEVKRIAEKCGLSVITARIDDILDSKQEADMEINRFILDVLAIILITTVIMLICIHISAIFTNLSEYGIMYANGFGIGNLAFMLFIELLFKMVIVCGCSLAFIKVLLFKIFYGIDGQVEVYNEIFYRYVVPGNILSAITVLIIAFVIPMIVLARQKPINLIGGNDT